MTLQFINSALELLLDPYNLTKLESYIDSCQRIEPGGFKTAVERLVLASELVHNQMTISPSLWRLGRKSVLQSKDSVIETPWFLLLNKRACGKIDLMNSLYIVLLESLENE